MGVLSNAIESIIGDSELDKEGLKKNAQTLLALALMGALDKTDIIKALGWK